MDKFSKFSKGISFYFFVSKRRGNTCYTCAIQAGTGKVLVDKMKFCLEACELPVLGR